MERARSRVLASVLAASLAAGCEIPLYRLSTEVCPVTRTPAADHVRVRYLGVGGFLLSHGTDSIMTAPLYSNPNLVEILMDHEVRSDTALVDQLLPAEATRARAILSGHSHYDHLMDAPYVAWKASPPIPIYGSSTTRHLLANAVSPEGGVPLRLEALDDLAWGNPKGTPGQWVAVTPTLRFVAIYSEHSDQTSANLMGVEMPVHLGRGTVDRDRAVPPSRTSEFAEGTVFAYVIDFLDASGTVVFRVYYQDSGTSPPKGLMPAELLPPVAGGRYPDLSILCVGGEFRRLGVPERPETSHPRAILANTRPRFVILGHWEDFFVTQRAYCADRRIVGIPGTKARLRGIGQSDTATFLQRVRDALHAEHLPSRVWLPCPTQSVFDLPIGAAPVVEGTEAYACPR